MSLTKIWSGMISCSRFFRWAKTNGKTQRILNSYHGTKKAADLVIRRNHTRYGPDGSLFSINRHGRLLHFRNCELGLLSSGNKNGLGKERRTLVELNLKFLGKALNLANDRSNTLQEAEFDSSAYLRNYLATVSEIECVYITKCPKILVQVFVYVTSWLFQIKDDVTSFILISNV